MLKLFLTPAERAEVEDRYRRGGTGYGVFKQMLVDKFHERFDGARAKRRELEKDLGFVRGVLRRGAERARAESARTLRDVQEACGVSGA
jgi:tryptophanyl-tRNA synthetase